MNSKPGASRVWTIPSCAERIPRRTQSLPPARALPTFFFPAEARHSRNEWAGGRPGPSDSVSVVKAPVSAWVCARACSSRACSSGLCGDLESGPSGLPLFQNPLPRWNDGVQCPVPSADGFVHPLYMGWAPCSQRASGWRSEPTGEWGHGGRGERGGSSPGRFRVKASRSSCPGLRARCWNLLPHMCSG